jgi:hypothetical protein
VKSEEMRRVIRRLERERLRLAPDAANAEEARKLEEAGWQRRGLGPKALWRRPEGERWWPHYQALIELRREGPDAPGEDE